LGGADLTSGSFNFVIEVCNGCRTTFVEDGLATDPGSGRIVCNDLLAEPIVATGCFYGQDGLFDCRLCSTRECSTFGG
jgi:hypothetical protein